MFVWFWPCVTFSLAIGAVASLEQGALDASIAESDNLRLKLLRREDTTRVRALTSPADLSEGTEIDDQTPILDISAIHPANPLPGWVVSQPLGGKPSLALPFVGTCSSSITIQDGSSDFGELGNYAYEGEPPQCNAENRQPPQRVAWKFDPSLLFDPVYDVMAVFEIARVGRLNNFATNGIYVKLEFDIYNGEVEHFLGEMGPQVRGGSLKGEVLNGQHFFGIADSIFPSADAFVNPDRRLALPGRSVPGDIGVCKRVCLQCDMRPDLLAVGATTGTACSLTFGAGDGQNYIYRVHRSQTGRKVNYNRAEYVGVEWEVEAMDALTNAKYILGRIITEGQSQKARGSYGIRHIRVSHMHIGCAECNAYYQAVRFTGPFILEPKNVHQIVHATLLKQPGYIHGDQYGVGANCTKYRVVSLSGYTLLFESGPFVQIDDRLHTEFDNVAFDCTLESGPYASPTLESTS